MSQNEVVSTLASSMSDGIVVPSIFKCARPIVQNRLYSYCLGTLFVLKPQYVNSPSPAHRNNDRLLAKVAIGII